MKIIICIELDEHREYDDEVFDGLQEACTCVVANMRDLGVLAIGHERYVTDQIAHHHVGQVSYYRPDE